MAVLDSSAIIHLLKGSEAGELIKQYYLEELNSTTTVCIHEVLIGAKGKQREEAIDFMKGLEILPFDEKAAQKSVELFDQLSKQGKSMQKLDLFIASICLARQIPIITTDNDFANIDNLLIRNVRNLRKQN